MKPVTDIKDLLGLLEKKLHPSVHFVEDIRREDHRAIVPYPVVKFPRSDRQAQYPLSLESLYVYVDLFKEADPSEYSAMIQEMDRTFNISTFIALIVDEED